MKFKSWVTPLAAMMLSLFSANASAVIYDFIKLTQDNPGGLGESAWSTLNVGNMHITGHATQGVAPGQDDDNQYENGEKCFFHSIVQMSGRRSRGIRLPRPCFRGSESCCGGGSARSGQ